MSEENSRIQSEPLVELLPASNKEVKYIISKSATKSCELDPVPTWLLKECINEWLPSITKVVNASMEQSFKQSLIQPLLKKSDFDANT